LEESGAEDGLGPDAFLFMAFRSFFGRGGVVTALHLPGQVRDDPALGSADESSADSTLGVRAKIGMARISASPSKLVIGEIKLSRACNCVYRE
jgi:hypothetical protein